MFGQDVSQQQAGPVSGGYLGAEQCQQTQAPRPGAVEYAFDASNRVSEALLNSIENEVIRARELGQSEGREDNYAQLDAAYAAIRDLAERNENQRQTIQKLQEQLAVEYQCGNDLAGQLGEAHRTIDGLRDALNAMNREMWRQVDAKKPAGFIRQVIREVVDPQFGLPCYEVMQVVSVGSDIDGGIHVSVR